MEYKKIKTNYSSDFRIEHNLGADWVMEYYHFHNVYEVYLALTDGAEFWVGSQRYVISPNDLLLLSTSDFHRSIILDKKSYERYILYFNPLYISSMNTDATNLLECFADRKSGPSHKITLKPEEKEALVNKMQELMVLQSDKKSYAADIKSKIQLTQILIYINEIFYQTNGFQEYNEINHASYQIIKPVMKYIETNYQQPITTDYLADRFIINRHQMNTMFRDITGLSFHQYMVHFRILKAKELLEGGVTSTTQVCMESGFNDYSHFIRTFKALVGISPGKYAKNYGSGKRI